MDQLRLHLLGGTSVTLQGEELSNQIPGKAMALLCYLAVKGEAQSRSTLAGLLWSDFPEHRARSNLRDALALLRRTPLAPYLDIKHRLVAFNTVMPHWLDAVEFEQGVALNTRELPTDSSALEAAVALYHGEFLAGFSIPKAALFEEWVTIQRQQIHLLAISALQQLVDCCIDTRSYASGITHANRLLILDPLREEAHRNLMLLLFLNNDSNAALNQYEHCRQILTEELGVDPSPKTQTLYQNIYKQLQGQPSAGKIQLAPNGLPPDAGSMQNIPGQVTPFFGRKKEQRAIDIVLSDRNARLITIFGVGGSGKTRLALAIAEKQVQAIERNGEFRFADGVFFVPLQTAESVDEIVPALCQAIGFQPADESQAGRSTERQLLDYLRHKRLLLVIDNFEQLMNGIDHLAKIHRSAPDVHLLVTSRQKLGLQGERLYALEGLPYPAPTEEVIEAQQLLANYDAAALFVAGARRMVSEFQLQDEEVPSLIHLCRLVDGLPLAIELAAGWTNVLSLAEIADEIERGLSFLESDLHDLPDRHRNMEAVFDVSWRRLAQSEQVVFAQLCVFRGGFTRQAAAQVVAASLLQLATLANKALIQFDKNSGRYQIHRLLHQFGAKKLARDTAAEKKVRDSHCAVYCAALQAWNAQLKGARQLQALAELDKEIANARAAWNYAIKTENVVELDRAADGLCRYYLWRRRLHAAEAACRLAEAALEQTLSANDAGEAGAEIKRVLARIQIWHSVFQKRSTASDLIEEVLLSLDDPQLAVLDTRRERAFGLQRAGDLSFDIDEEQARCFYKRSLALYRELDDVWGTAKLLTALGWLAAHSGETEEARRLAQEALALIQSGGDMKRTADILWLLGTVATREGQLEESGHLFAKCLNIRAMLGDRLTDIAAGPIDLGMPLTWIGRFAEADAIREEALALYEAQKQPERIAQAHVFLANSKLHIGQLEKAKHHALIGLQLCQQGGNQRGAGMALWTLAVLAINAREYDQAELYLQDGEAIFRQIEGAAELGWVLGMYAIVACGQGRPGAAQRYIFLAGREASGILGVVTIFGALIAYMYLLADKGRDERAAEIGALLEKHPFTGASIAARGMFADHLAEIRAGLPPEVAAQAQARGEARNFQETIVEVLAELEAVESQVTTAA